MRVNDNKFLRLSTVSAAIPHSKIIEQKKAHADSVKKFTILSVGRLVGIKSFDIGIKAFNSFYLSIDSVERRNTELLIVGSGPLLEKLKSLSKSLECHAAINFIEWVEQDELYEIYKLASVLLVPSHEGAGAVVAEGLSYALPIICFDNFGAGEIVNKSCGRKVKMCSLKNSIDNMANELACLYKDQDLLRKLQDGAYSKFISDLSWDAKGNVLRDIYKNL